MRGGSCGLFGIATTTSMRLFLDGGFLCLRATCRRAYVAVKRVGSSAGPITIARSIFLAVALNGRLLKGDPVNHRSNLKITYR
jgi:hypothetical protein